MRTNRTLKQWQKLLANRESFTGTNTEFCKQYGISITSFYKHQARLRNQTATSFVQVKTTSEQTQFATHSDIQFDLHSGQLTLPSTMPSAQIVAIIKGVLQ